MRKVLLISALLCGVALGTSRYEIQLPSPKVQGINVNVRGVELGFLLNLIGQEAGVPITFRELPQEVLQARVNYFSLNKPFRVVMDELTSMHDLWWEEKGSAVEVYRYRAVSFKISLPFLEKGIEQSDGGLKLSYKKNFWDKLEEGIKALVKDPGSKVSITETGFVILYARPSEVRAVSEFVERINGEYSKPIPLVVTAYLMSDETFRQVGTGINFGGGSARGSLAPQTTTPVFTLSVLTSRLELSLKALAQSGRASILEKASLTALNGQPIYYAPLKTVRIIKQFDVSFVSPLGGLVGGGGGGGGQQLQTGVVPTVRVVTEDVPSGTTLIIVPYYLSQEQIVVDLYRRQDRIERIDRLAVNLPGAGQNFINLPQMATTTNLNQTVLRYGESIMLFTGAMTAEELKDSGLPFLKDVPVLGYLFSTKDRRTELYRLVVTIKFGTEEEKEEVIKNRNTEDKKKEERHEEAPVY